MTFLCFVLSLFLGTRSFVLAWKEKTRWRYAHGAATVLFVSMGVFLFFLDPSHLSLKHGIIFLLTLLLAIFFPVYRKRRISICKSLFFCMFLVLYFLNLSLSLLTYFAEDLPILKVTLTGSKRQDWFTWKNPTQALQKNKIYSYQVKLATPEGTPLSEFYLSGDLMGIRAKVLRFHPILNRLGFRNVCHIDAIYNSYKTLHRFQSLPSQGYEIPYNHSLTITCSKWIWSFWEKIYQQKAFSNLVKSATLESSYFPLVDQKGYPFKGSYWLTITDGGLSSLPAK